MTRLQRIQWLRLGREEKIEAAFLQKNRRREEAYGNEIHGSTHHIIQFIFRESVRNVEREMLIEILKYVGGDLLDPRHIAHGSRCVIDSEFHGEHCLLVRPFCLERDKNSPMQQQESPF